jgi:hypothetical protein
MGLSAPLAPLQNFSLLADERDPMNIYSGTRTDATPDLFVDLQRPQLNNRKENKWTIERFANELEKLLEVCVFCPNPICVCSVGFDHVYFPFFHFSFLLLFFSFSFSSSLLFFFPPSVAL